MYVIWEGGNTIKKRKEKNNNVTVSCASYQRLQPSYLNITLLHALLGALQWLPLLTVPVKQNAGYVSIHTCFYYSLSLPSPTVLTFSFTDLPNPDTPRNV